jgi:LemA protein
MSPALLTVLVAFGLLLLLAVVVVGIYNGLVTLRNGFRNAFAQVDVQLKRRHDLIPNLVETAKGYMAHERQTLEAVISARAAATQANLRVTANPADAAAVGALGQAEAGLTTALGRLLAVAENYPQLKADTTMRSLMEELTSTENRIAFSRQAFNDGVLAYNNRRETFPAVLLAAALGFQPAEFLRIESEAERQAPKVGF